MINTSIAVASSCMAIAITRDSKAGRRCSYETKFSGAPIRINHNSKAVNSNEIKRFSFFRREFHV
jgi:hypothetical protein